MDRCGHRDPEGRALGVDDLRAVPRPARPAWPGCRRWCTRCRSRRRDRARAARRRSARRTRRAAAGSAGRRPGSPRCRRSATRCGSGCRSGPAPGRRGRRAAPAAAAPPAMEKPNFWSSWAVAMYSWVCASTPVVTRTITRGRTPSSAASAPSRAISSKESTMIRPTPAVQALPELRRRSCCCRAARPGAGRPRPAARRPARRRCRRRRPRPSSADPARHRRAEERLGGVVDVPAGERVGEGPGAGAQVGLVHHVRRGAHLLGDLGRR